MSQSNRSPKRNRSRDKTGRPAPPGGGAAGTTAGKAEDPAHGLSTKPLELSETESGAKSKREQEKKNAAKIEELRQKRLSDILSAEPAMILYSDRLRETVRHENELVNHRIHWLVLLNGLAFAGTGVLWGKVGVDWILLALSAAGMICSFSCFLALQGGRLALRRLNHLWDTLEEAVEGLAPVSGRSHSHAAKMAELEKGDASGREPTKPSPNSPDYGINYSPGEKFLLWVDRGNWSFVHPLTLIPPVMILVWIMVAGSIIWAMCDDDPEECEIASVTVEGVEVKVTHGVVPKDKAGGADAARAAEPQKPAPDPKAPKTPETPPPPVGEKEAIRPTGSGTSPKSPKALPEGSGK